MRTPSGRRSPALARCALLAASLAVTGCPATGDEVRPPADQFYFPTGMDLAPDESVLFVANANSDLRFDSGTALSVDLDRVDDLVNDWLSSGEAPSGADCEVDLMVPYTLICDEREGIVPDGGVRIGNFATELKVQALDDEGRLRLFAAVRGDPSVTWIDYDAGARDLTCGSSEGFPECDDDHRLVQIGNDEDLPALPNEPFGLFVDSVNGYALVTHLNSGAVTLVDAPGDGAAPVLADAVANLFAQNPNTLQFGAVGAAGRQPGTPNDRIYITSRAEARVQTLIVVRASGLPSLIAAEHFFINRVVPSTDARGIAFSGDGNRAYIVNRDPPMLHIIDTSMDPIGVPRNEFLTAVELCSQPSNLTVTDVDPTDAVDERVYVACFRNGQIWAVDPVAAVVDSIIDVGRGPHAIVASPSRNHLYVSNFLEDTIAVIDTEPGSETENRVVFRLGRGRRSGEGPQ